MPGHKVTDLQLGYKLVALGSSGPISCDWGSLRTKRVAARLAGAGGVQLGSPSPCLIAIHASVQTRIKHVHWAAKLRKAGSSGHAVWGAALGGGGSALPFERTQYALTLTTESQVGHPAEHVGVRGPPAHLHGLAESIQVRHRLPLARVQNP